MTNITKVYDTKRYTTYTKDNDDGTYDALYLFKSPTNPRNGQPYFTIPTNAWQGEIKIGNLTISPKNPRLNTI